jgi:hypothetical protein
LRLGLVDVCGTGRVDNLDIDKGGVGSHDDEDVRAFLRVNIEAGGFDGGVAAIHAHDFGEVLLNKVMSVCARVAHRIGTVQYMPRVLRE